MKKSSKAALLSAFVFPGAGHFFLKKYILGIILLFISLCGAYYLTSIMFEKATQLTEQILSGKVQPNAAAITDLISAQSTGPEAQRLDIVTYVIFLCWLIGIIDSYRQGLVLDKEARASELVQKYKKPSS